MAVKRVPVGFHRVTPHLTVRDARAMIEFYRRAFWGDRYGIVKDPSGHHWSIAHHAEDLTPAQMQERMAKAFCA